MYAPFFIGLLQTGNIRFYDLLAARVKVYA
jgi:hypothetical protein